MRTVSGTDASHGIETTIIEGVASDGSGETDVDVADGTQDSVH